MCGLAGYVGVPEEARWRLTAGLGFGIDKRGGHSSGFVSIGDTLRYCRKSGKWSDGRKRWFETASSGNLCMMHARWATCGDRYEPNQAHPFAIKREGKTVLWGAHNGVIYDAWESAEKYNHYIDVDSQEIFEHLADQNYQAIQDMNGYGVITWIDNEARDRVSVARLSSHSDFEACQVKEGGVVWASTKLIVQDALKLASLNVDYWYDLDEVGRVYHMYAEHPKVSPIVGVNLSKGDWGWGTRVDVSKYLSPEEQAFLRGYDLD